MRMNSLLLSSILAVAAIASGCGSKGGGETGQTPAVVEAQVRPENEQQVLAELTGAVHRCWVGNGRPPKTLDEVVAAGYLKAIPTPPAGKRFVIEPRAIQVVLADQ